MLSFTHYFQAPATQARNEGDLFYTKQDLLAKGFYFLLYRRR